MARTVGTWRDAGANDHQEEDTTMMLLAIAAVAALPMISGPVTTPGGMYPDPAISIVPTAVKG